MFKLEVLSTGTRERWCGRRRAPLAGVAWWTSGIGFAQGAERRSRLARLISNSSSRHTKKDARADCSARPFGAGPSLAVLHRKYAVGSVQYRLFVSSDRSVGMPGPRCYSLSRCRTAAVSLSSPT